MQPAEWKARSVRDTPRLRTESQPFDWALPIVPSVRSPEAMATLLVQELRHRHRLLGKQPPTAAWFGKFGQNFDLPTSDAPSANRGCTPKRISAGASKAVRVRFGLACVKCTSVS